MPPFLYMANIATAYENLKALVDGFEPMLVQTFHDNKMEFVDYIQEQLYSGIDGKDKNLTPNYLSDPYFLTSDAGRWKNNAKGYMLWKKKTTPPLPSYLGINPRRDIIPNLIITGSFYESIRPIATPEGVKIETRGFESGADIESKYGSQIFSLSSYARNYFIKYVLLKEINKYFSKFGL